MDEFLTGLQFLIDDYKLNASKFYRKGNKSAGIRARKSLSLIMKVCKVAREDIQQTKRKDE